MIWFQNNVPQVYVEESRDFQLIGRIIETIINANIYNNNSILSTLDAKKINERLLELLATKVGFYHKHNIDVKVLRYIISAFPYIIKYKGSKKGIESAINVILKIEQPMEPPEINIDNINYSINIYTNKKLVNKDALSDILEYIVPVGYTYSIQEYQKRSETDTIFSEDSISYIKAPITSTTQIKGSNRVLDINKTNPMNYYNELEARNLTALNNSQIIGSTNYIKAVKDDLSDDEIKANNINQNKIYGHYTGNTTDIQKEAIIDSNIDFIKEGKGE